MIYHNDPQNTEGWWESRRGVITASRASDARNRTNGLTKQQKTYVEAVLNGASQAEACVIAGYKKPSTSEDVASAIAGTLPLKWGDNAISYAKDVARERCGGKVPQYGGAMATRMGQEEEQFGRIAYMAKTGHVVDEVGFATTDDRKFGMSLDGRKRPDGAVEIKTMVSSSTLFQAMVDGDISEYRDQCLFGLWLFRLDWIDLCLWMPDFQQVHVIRIERDEAEIQALEDDLLAFEKLVCEYETALRRAMGGDITPVVEPPPWAEPAAPKQAAAPLPDNLFA